MINYLGQQAATIATLQKDNEERKEREKSQVQEESIAPILGGNRLMITAAPGAGRQSPANFGQTNGFVPQATGYGGFWGGFVECGEHEYNIMTGGMAHDHFLTNNSSEGLFCWMDGCIREVLHFSEIFAIEL